LADGRGITIYPGHAPLLAETVTAPIRYADEGGEHGFDAEAGILHVDRAQVTIFTSASSEVEAAPEPFAMPEQRRFERLARELRDRLEDEPNAVLPDGLNDGDE
jgi:F0F1-type ATP synthase epsilon subunit